MSRFAPEGFVFVESIRKPFVALTDSSCAVLSSVSEGIIGDEIVFTVDSSEVVVIRIVGVVVEESSVRSSVGVANMFITVDVSVESFSGTFVTLPKLHACFVDEIDWFTNTGNEVVSTFW